MSFTALLIVAFGTAFGVTWLISYVPIEAKTMGTVWSPRIVICKLLAPFDVMITFWLSFGAMTGLTTMAMGISTIVYSILVGLGFSAAVVIVKKWFVPHWQKQFEKKKQQKEKTI